MKTEHTPVGGHTSDNICTAQAGFPGYFLKRGHKIGWVGKGWIWEELWEEAEYN